MVFRLEVKEGLFVQISGSNEIKNVLIEKCILYCLRKKKFLIVCVNHSTGIGTLNFGKVEISEAYQFSIALGELPMKLLSLLSFSGKTFGSLLTKT